MTAPGAVSPSPPPDRIRLTVRLAAAFSPCTGLYILPVATTTGCVLMEAAQSLSKPPAGGMSRADLAGTAWTFEMVKQPGTSFSSSPRSTTPPSLPCTVAPAAGTDRTSVNLLNRPCSCLDGGPADNPQPPGTSPDRPAESWIDLGLQTVDPGYRQRVRLRRHLPAGHR